jgi:hypothetical protein
LTKLFTIADPNERERQKYFLLILVILLLIVFPWMVRSVILSGYIAYPFPYLSFPMDWRIPFENALNEYLWIKSWARMPYIPPAQVLSDWHWLWPWTRELFNNRFLLFMIVFPMGLACLGLILMFRKLKEIPRALYSFALFMAPPVLSLFFGFRSAPDQRFAGVSFWYLGAGTLAVSSQYLKFPPRQVQFFFAILTALVLLLSVTFYRGSLQQTHTLVPSAYGFYPLPIVELYENYTNSGLRVFTPKKGNQCWDGPIPCTPLVQANLCLRKRNDIASGFKISFKEKIKTQQE